MIVYFANRKMEVLGQASTSLPSGIRIKEDVKTEDVETGVATFSCRIPFTRETKKRAEQYTETGNYILRNNEDEHEIYTIIETEINTDNQDIYIYAEDAGLDLLNEVLKEYEADKEYFLKEYAETCLTDSGFEIGINECTEKKLKLSGRSEETATERLLYIAGQFECELSFSFSIKDMMVTHKYVNFYKQRGKDNGVQLRLNKEIDKITVKKTVANLATCYLCTGASQDGTDIPTTLDGYKYDDGDFYVDGHYLKSRNAVERWGRYAWSNEPNKLDGYEGHIVKMFTYDTVSQEELCKQAIDSLKKVCNAEVNYEAEITEFTDSIKIGDTVNIIDDMGELYLSARILKLEKSVVDHKNTVTLGDYLIKESGVSEKVEALSAQFAIEAKKRPFYTWIAYADDKFGSGISLNSDGKYYMGIAENQIVLEADISRPEIYKWTRIKGEEGESGQDAILLRVVSSRGTVFKNNAISTVLSVTIYYGSERITNIQELKETLGSNYYLEWYWKSLDDESFGVISSSDNRIGNNGFTFTLTPEDFNAKVDFLCNLMD
ncbi:MAG: phage tail protein [Anaerostipes sp.]|nr:phage tail protein [Anaerostipes sp.]